MNIAKTKAISALLSAILLLCCTQPTLAELRIGSPAPDFELQSSEGKTVKLSELRGKTVILEWFNYGCPYVRKHYDKGNMQALQNKFSENAEVVWLTVNSTNPEHRDYQTAEETNALIKKLGVKSNFLLLDADGKVGKSYGAKTTPHIFVVDSKGILVYRGAIDDAPDTDSNPKEAKNFLSTGVEAMLSGKSPDPAETKPYGCSVKYS